MVSRTILAVLAFVAVVAFAGSALAGEAGGGGRGGGGRGGAGGADFRTRMMDNIKTSLGATDEEWKVLQPQIEKVQTLSRQMQGGMAGMFGRRGGPGGAPGAAPAADNAAPQTKLETTTQALTTVLANKDATPEQIKTALTALRDARAKVKAELDKAKADLKKLLTLRWEAQLAVSNPDMVD